MQKKLQLLWGKKVETITNMYSVMINFKFGFSKLHQKH